MSNLTTSEVLDLAADTIELRGWNGIGEGAAGKPFDLALNPWGGGAGQSQPVCLEGAIAAAMGIGLPLKEWGNLHLLRVCPAYAAMQEYLSVYGELWQWNDHRDRTRDDVIVALRGAAAVERAKEESIHTQEVCA